MYGKLTWDKLNDMCCNDTDPNRPITQCPFDKFVTINRWGSIEPKRETPAIYACGKLVKTLVQTWVQETLNDVYNLYQDCYEQQQSIFPFAGNNRQKVSQLLDEIQEKHAELPPNIRLAYMKAMPWFTFTYSTDALGGFPCYMMYAATKYLNQKLVREALHVPDYVSKWKFCTFLNYYKQVNDTKDYFKNILENIEYPLHVLIYVGDTDSICSMSQSEWFVEDFKAKRETTPWFYRLSEKYEYQVGGYWKRYVKDYLTLDMLTVKGAGHMVPTDRAGPCLQMITNFVHGKDYGETYLFNYERKPLLPDFTPLPTETIQTTTRISTVTSISTGTID
ncbi:unnamed protein product [Thelazia callipaeda]|uniref:Serine carboxypeptidase n=1 Tax=Thelazia callipaeda TaxID=103827 RepID=A0A0N5CRN7_THECL|nr:unnamed protein product [Thelazia callipaeda]